MKKVLFATTALVATAGIAAADVTLSGSGRFGVVYNNNKGTSALTGNTTTGTGSKTRVEKRMTINIDGSGATDSGLEFGGRIRLRSDENEGAGSAVASANIYFGNDTFRVTIGNTDGALVNRVNYFQGSVGLTGLHYANVSYNIGSSRWYVDSYSSRGGGSADVVRLDFNAAGFGVSLSTDSQGTTATAVGRETAIGLSYEIGDWAVAAGYAKNVNNSATSAAEQNLVSLSATGNIGDFGVGLGYSDLENVGSKVVLNGSYDFGDTTVTAFIASTREDRKGSTAVAARGTAASVGSAGISANNGSKTEYGIGFTQSLGGATLAGGISSDYQKNLNADLGVRFNF